MIFKSGIITGSCTDPRAWRSLELLHLAITDRACLTLALNA